MKRAKAGSMPAASHGVAKGTGRAAQGTGWAGAWTAVLHTEDTHAGKKAGVKG